MYAFVIISDCYLISCDYIRYVIMIDQLLMIIYGLSNHKIVLRLGVDFDYLEIG